MKKIFGAKKIQDPPPSIQDATDRVCISYYLRLDGRHRPGTHLIQDATDRREHMERERKSSAAAMASGGFMAKKELGETHDVLRFGVNDSVRGDLAPVHPVQTAIHKENKFWDEKKKFGTKAIYGSAFNIRKDLDAQILSRYNTLTESPSSECREAKLF
ncbi:uncharacterized protein LOC123425426 isoform X2 [Hordeum vulgare subsp. vulgare]|uniref:Predicted protein n=1 Tax=Hordeum vulgare subsp. vulgare TaxID=112509 RepID=F2EDN2_HORVV|nr:uncharacterized protein LOC123425426 isoform X2 [Hordeum vulgare subsp. vulgare]BAK05454.1 predicted protein [Hordeum vulgare subsp. vulgare]